MSLFWGRHFCYTTAAEEEAIATALPWVSEETNFEAFVSPVFLAHLGTVYHHTFMTNLPIKRFQALLLRIPARKKSLAGWHFSSI